MALAVSNLRLVVSALSAFDLQLTCVVQLHRSLTLTLTLMSTSSLSCPPLPRRVSPVDVAPVPGRSWTRSPHSMCSAPPTPSRISGAGVLRMYVAPVCSLTKSRSVGSRSCKASTKRTWQQQRQQRSRLEGPRGLVDSWRQPRPRVWPRAASRDPRQRRPPCPYA